MTQISLAKALKEKNKLVHEMNKAFQRVQSNNSFIKENKDNVNYDSKKELDNFLNLKTQLVNLKTKISLANAPIQSLIYSLSEHKATINNLNSISTNKGQVIGGRFSDVEGKVEYDAIITKLEIDTMISDYEKKVEDIQDQIDTFNHVTQIEI